jgi:hypothetical protein
MTFSAGVMAVVAEGEEAERYRQLQPEVPCACGPPDVVAAILRRYAGAGCDHAILSLSPNLSMDLDAQMLEPMADVLPLAR